MNNRGILIAGTHSGCGKTTVSMGLMRAFARRGYAVQPWKAGPDYLDPKLHTIAAGRTSRNLDTMLCEPQTVEELYHRQPSDISIVEGVMGLYDGAGAHDERGSAAHLSKILKLPVILVIDARAMARSAAALIKGFCEFDPEVNVAGVIFNRVGSRRHSEILTDAIDHYTDIPVIGSIPKDETLIMGSRHLGLIPAEDTEIWNNKFDEIAEILEEYLDLDMLLRIAEQVRSSELVTQRLPVKGNHHNGKIRIGIAQDSAFNFYYQDNLDLMEASGAQLISFSPISDKRVPDDLSAIYFGGGYPELHARELSENKTMRRSLVDLIESEIPVLAECGGLMYLCNSIETSAERYPMLGVFDYQAIMNRSLRSLGYCEVDTLHPSIFGDIHSKIKGHVFHWAELDRVIPKREALFSVKKGERVLNDGLTYKNTLGSWVHFHFASNIHILRSFIQKAEEYHGRE